MNKHRLEDFSKFPENDSKNKMESDLELELMRTGFLATEARHIKSPVEIMDIINARARNQDFLFPLYNNRLTESLRKKITYDGIFILDGVEHTMVNSGSSWARFDNPFVVLRYDPEGRTSSHPKLKLNFFESKHSFLHRNSFLNIYANEEDSIYADKHDLSAFLYFSKNHELSRSEWDDVVTENEFTLGLGPRPKKRMEGRENHGSITFKVDDDFKIFYAQATNPPWPWPVENVCVDFRKKSEQTFLEYVIKKAGMKPLEDHIRTEDIYPNNPYHYKFCFTDKRSRIAFEIVPERESESLGYTYNIGVHFTSSKRYISARHLTEASSGLNINYLMIDVPDANLLIRKYHSKDLVEFLSRLQKIYE